MYKYQTTNDFRLGEQAAYLYEVALAYLHPDDNSVSHNTSFNNNVKPYLGINFGLKSCGLRAKQIENKDFAYVYLNFIKKFQFPNPAANNFDELIEQNVCVAPLREVIKILFYLHKKDISQAYLTYKEINSFVFFNPHVVESNDVDYDKLVNAILLCRKTNILPNYIINDDQKPNAWKEDGRNFKELVDNILSLDFIVCLRGRISFKDYNDNKSKIMEIVNFNTFIRIPTGKTKSEFEKIYLDYFNDDQEKFALDIDNEQAFRDWLAQQKKDNGELYADTTIGQECNSIKDVKSKDSIKDIMPCENLFVIDDAESIDKVRKELESKIVDDELARNEADGLPNALNLYYDFLVWKHSQKTEDATNLSHKEIVDKISNYIKYKGFNYSGNLIENFYLSLKSKPFVILAGISGTGKTRLVKLFAEAIGATEENKRYKLISVRPDWSDSSDLFGHLDLQNNFVTGKLTEIIRKANADPNTPYFVCLDEMNLARVEYYLSDFLSNIETRELRDGKIVTKEPIFIIPKHKDCEQEEKLYLPDNLYIVGTVNMDETTFPFSKKVLDRANTIEFSEVDLKVEDAGLEEQPVLTGVINDFLKSEYVILKDGYNDSTKEFLDKWIERLEIINSQLKKIDMHVGYRVRDEICFYMLNSRGIFENENEAFNTEVMQKILPRIQGSNPEIRNVLTGIFNACNFGTAIPRLAEDDNPKNLIKVMEEVGNNNPLANKIVYMIKRLENNEFTSFWI